MNIRNWVFDTVFPSLILKKIVMHRVACKGVALMYHEVLPDAQGPSAWTVVKASAFHEQMLFLKRYFDVMTLDEALERRCRRDNSGKPFAVITFDDGYRGNFSCVLPIIEDLQIPIHVFVSTRATETGKVYWYDTLISLYHYHGRLEVSLEQYGLGKYHLKRTGNEKKNWAAMQELLTALKTLAPATRKRIVADTVDQMGNVPNALQMMTIHELQKLADSPLVTIGGHSHCHNILPQLTDDDLNASLKINRNRLRKWTRQKVEHFSYPNGDYDKRVVRAVRQVGYKSAVTTLGKHWAGDIKPFELPRFGVGRFDSPGLFIARLGRLA